MNASSPSTTIFTSCTRASKSLRDVSASLRALHDIYTTRELATSSWDTAVTNLEDEFTTIDRLIDVCLRFSGSAACAAETHRAQAIQVLEVLDSLRAALARVDTSLLTALGKFHHHHRHSHSVRHFFAQVGRNEGKAGSRLLVASLDDLKTGVQPLEVVCAGLTDPPRAIHT